MGRASNLSARERMVSQEMTAKTIDSTSNNRKVRRQRSLWRRSNCSRRSEMAGRGAEPRDELSARFGTFFLPSFIIPASPGFGRDDRSTSASHFRIRYCRGHTSNHCRFPERHLSHRTKNENGVSWKGTPFVWFVADDLGRFCS